MAISYVGGKVAGSAGQGGGSVAINSGLTGGSGSAAAAGELVVVTVCVATQGRTPTISIATPTGYTALSVQRTSATTYDTNVQTCYKIMGGTPDTAVTIPASGDNADAIAYTIQVFRGVHATTPEDVTSQYATDSGTDNLPNGAAITPVTTGAWVVVCGGGAAQSSSDFTASELTDFISAGGADTNDADVGSGYYTAWTSGAFNPAKFGGGSTNSANSWGCTTIALRPAVVTVAVTGVAGTGAVGNETPKVIKTPTGVSATGAVQDVVVEITSGDVFVFPLGGWGRGGWGQFRYGMDTISVQGTGAIGTVTVKLNRTVSVSGVAGTGAVGNETPKVIKTPTGVSATGAVAGVNEVVRPGLSGVAGTGAIGAVIEVVRPPFTGVGGVGAVSGVTEVVRPVFTGVAGTGAIGNVGLVYSGTEVLVGVAGTGAVGQVVVALNRQVVLTGVSAAGYIGAVRLVGWFLVNDSQTPNWGPVTDSQTPDWVPVDDSQGAPPGWATIGTVQTPNWVPVVESQVPQWQTIDTDD